MNTFMTTFMPFLNLLIIVVVVVMIIKVFKSTKNKLFFKTGQVLKLIVVSYIVFLTLAVLIAYLLPTPNLAKELDIDVEELEYLVGNFYNIADSGELESTVGIYETDKWSFEYQKEQLTVLENGDNWILYEKKTENDDQIDVVRYTTKYIYKVFDYTDKIEVPTVELAGNQLTITEPPWVNIRVADFHKEFTITQFTGESMFNGHNPIRGNDALVIRVPANVEIVTNQQDSVHYINE